MRVPTSFVYVKPRFANFFHSFKNQSSNNLITRMKKEDHTPRQTTIRLYLFKTKCHMCTSQSYLGYSFRFHSTFQTKQIDIDHNFYQRNLQSYIGGDDC